MSSPPPQLYQLHKNSSWENDINLFLTEKPSNNTAPCWHGTDANPKTLRANWKPMHSPDGCLSVLVCVYRQTSPSCKQNILQTAEQASQNQLTFTQAPVDASCRNASSFEVKLPRLKAEKKRSLWFNIWILFWQNPKQNKISAPQEKCPSAVAPQGRGCTQPCSNADTYRCRSTDSPTSRPARLRRAAVHGCCCKREKRCKQKSQTTSASFSF